MVICAKWVTFTQCSGSVRSCPSWCCIAVITVHSYCNSDYDPPPTSLISVFVTGLQSSEGVNVHIHAILILQYTQFHLK